MGTSHFIKAPVSGEQLHGDFAYYLGVDEKKRDILEPLTPEDEERVAGIVNGLVTATRMALWFNPETDKKVAKLHGEPLEIDGKPVRFIPADEVAIFPPREVA